MSDGARVECNNSNYGTIVVFRHLLRTSVVYSPREKTAAPLICPALLASMSDSEHHGSIEEELVAWPNHTDGLLPTNNATVYYKLEKDD